MPKFAKSIIDISDGINSDSSAQVISDNSVHDAVNINIDRIGKIKPTSGFESNGSFANTGKILSFRTDDGGDTPKEFMVMQDDSNNVSLRDTVGLLTQRHAFNPGFRAGFNYSNGVLFAYPKDLDASPRVYFAGDFGTGFDINYDNEAPTLGLILNGELVSGSSSANVVFTLTEDFVANEGTPAEIDLDVTGISFAGGNISVDYNNVFEEISVSESSTSTSFGFNLTSALNGSSLPLSASFNSSTLIITIVSDLIGTDGNKPINIYVDGQGITFLSETMQGGTDQEFDTENIDKIVPAGEYKFSSSLVYWDGSETRPKSPSVSVTFEERTKFSVRVRVNYSSFNDKIEKLKTYISSESYENSLLCEYDPNNSNGRFKFYNESEFSTNDITSHDIDLTLPMNTTFAFESGYDSDERASPRMRKFLIVNNRGYAFNVSYGINYYQDRMIISPQGKPYLLPENNKIDVVTEDGDEYVTAEHYGSFIYAFKNYTLYVINIASNDPSSFFLASSIYGVGVNDEKSVTKTEFGIFWANKNGIYTHNGERIQNLTFNKIEDEWRSNSSDDISCGYDIINKKVVFNRGDTTYIYDMKLSSFSKLKVLSTGTKSNFFVRDDKLSVFEGSQLKTLTLGDSSTAWSLTTKSYTLDKVAVRKKIRRFYVTFKDKSVNLSNVTFEYSLDNTDDWTTITDKEFINDDDGVAKDTVARFNLPRSITAYSVQLRLSSSSVMSEIEDITIIYRAKHPK